MWNKFSMILQPFQRESPLSSPQLYDVFISHRGPDVKQTLASQFYRSLQRRRCRVFLDSEEIKAGDSVSSTIQNAISSSLVQIAIFSRGYAESKWCLDELLLMLQQSKALFIPIFYEVDPRELRHIETGVYAEAFSNYKRKGRNLNKLADWKSALHRASEIYGYELSKLGLDLCDTVVFAVVKWIEARRPLHVAKYPVGLDELVKDFETHCRKHKNIKYVGIFGLGGLGKTTLAKELFNRKRSNYNASCFLNAVRHGKLQSMQTKLLKELFGEDYQFDNADEGSTHLTNRLIEAPSTLRFLIVLDDIDHHNQLDALSFTDMQRGDNLVIVTTRDERVLIRARISVRYNMKALDMVHARELFCSHAFLQPYPDTGYEDLVERYVMFCGGLPLSLTVLGAHVSGSDESYWQLELNKVEETLHGDIIPSLKISFDSLNKVEKQIFMDIACFFIGEEKERAIRIWKGSGWSAEPALQTLRDKSLVELEVVEFSSQNYFLFRMHDHLRDMGRRMAEELSPPRLWQPHHLRSVESKGFRKILAETNGRCFHKFWDSSMRCTIRYFIGNTNDFAETSTVLLWLELELDAECQLTRIPSWIPLQKLQGLYIDGPLSWDLNVHNDTQANFELKELSLHGYDPMLNLPKLIGMLNHLESLVLTRRPHVRDMVTDWSSFLQSLRKLRNLRKIVLRRVSLSGEVALSNHTDSTHSESSTSTCMNSLETIQIDDGILSKLLISGKTCPRLRSLTQKVTRDQIEVDLKQVTTLNHLWLSDCYKLKIISGLSDLAELQTLFIEECPELEELPTLAHLKCLESITITGACHKLRTIAGIEKLEGLKHLHLCGVKGRVGVWNCIYRLKRLPSEVTIVTCVDAKRSSLNVNLIRGVIDANSVNKIHFNRFGFVDGKLKMEGSMSALILCFWFRCIGSCFIRTPGGVISKIPQGEGMVTIVVTDKTEIDQYHRFKCDTQIMGGYMVNVRKGEEWKTMEIFKRIIGEVYL